MSTKPVSETQAHSDETKKIPRPKKRLWLKVVIAVVVLVVILIALVPAIISTGPTTRFISTYSSGMVKGAIQIDDLSLGWFSPAEVKGLRIIDPQGRQVLAVDSVTCGGGLWGALMDYASFGSVNVQADKASILVDEDGNVSFLQALESSVPPASEPVPSPGTPPAPPAPSAPPGKLPPLTGTISVHVNSVDIQRAGPGAPVQYALKDVTCDVALKTLNDIQMTASLITSAGEPLEIKASLKDLASTGRFALDKANGTVSIRTPRQIDIHPLSGLVLGRDDMKGKADLTVDLVADHGKFDGTTLALAGNQIGQLGKDASIRPINFALKGAINGTVDDLKGALKLSGDVGSTDLDVSYRKSEIPPGLTAQKMMEVFLNGGGITLPDFQATVTQCSIDLPKLAEAVPALMNLRPDVKLQKGRLTADLAVKGGAVPSVKGTIKLIDVEALQGGKPVKLNPATIVLDGGFDEQKKRLVVNDVSIDARGVAVKIFGDGQKIDGTIDTDLAMLQNELAQIIDFGGVVMQGRIDKGTFNLTRKDASNYTHSFGIALKGLSLGKPGEVRGPLDIGFTESGAMVLAENKFQRVTVGNYTLGLDDKLALTGEGFYDLKVGEFHFKSAIDKGDLQQVTKLAAVLGVTDMPKLTGLLGLNVSADRKSAEAPVILAGDFNAQGAALPEKQTTIGNLTGNWKDIQIDSKKQTIQVPSFKVKGDFADASADKVVINTGKALEITGDATVNADLAPTAKVINAFKPETLKPELQGRFAWSGKGATTAGKSNISGQATIDNLKVGTGQTAFQEKSVTLNHNVDINPTAKSINIVKLDFTSAPLKLNLSGPIEKYDTDAILNLKGHYDGDCDKLMALVHQFAPATADTISLSGPTASDLAITGPANRPTVTPVYKGVASGVKVGWTSGKVYGVELGQATLVPSLADGKITLAPASFAAAGGKVNLRGVVDLTGTSPVYTLAGQEKILDEVRITPEMGKQLLSRVNPIFADAVKLDGKVTLQLQDLRVPFSELGKAEATGRGRMDMSQLAIEPSGFLSKLITFVGHKTDQTKMIKVQGVDFNIRRGGIDYDNFNMDFGGDFQLGFSGYVGFDDSLNLNAKIPITEGLLKNLGVRLDGGSAAEYADLLKGKTLILPIRGTRLNATFNPGEGNIKELILDAGKELLRRKAQKGLEDLLKPKDDKKQPEKAPDADKPKEDKPTDNPLDILKDVLKKDGDKKEQK